MLRLGALRGRRRRKPRGHERRSRTLARSTPGRNRRSGGRPRNRTPCLAPFPPGRGRPPGTLGPLPPEIHPCAYSPRASERSFFSRGHGNGRFSTGTRAKISLRWSSSLPRTGRLAGCLVSLTPTIPTSPSASVTSAWGPQRSATCAFRSLRPSAAALACPWSGIGTSGARSRPALTSQRPLRG